MLRTQWDRETKLTYCKAYLLLYSNSALCTRRPWRSNKRHVISYDRRFALKD